MKINSISNQAFLGSLLFKDKKGKIYHIPVEDIRTISPNQLHGDIESASIDFFKWDGRTRSLQQAVVDLGNDLQGTRGKGRENYDRFLNVYNVALKAPENTSISYNV